MILKSAVQCIILEVSTILNEIAQSAMKSSLRSDEICFADEIKSVPLPDEVGFHHEVISSHESGIYPVRKDGFS